MTTILLVTLAAAGWTVGSFGLGCLLGRALKGSAN